MSAICRANSGAGNQGGGGDIFPFKGDTTGRKGWGVRSDGVHAEGGGAAKVGSQQQPASSGHGRHQLVRDRGIEGALTGGVRATMPGDSNRFKWDSNRFEYFQIHSKFDRFKLGLSELKHFEIKYGYEGFGERNNFLYINFFKFEVEFELKFR
jgi:hypothetical protein